MSSESIYVVTCVRISFLFKAELYSFVGAQSCSALCNPMDCNLYPWHSAGKNTGVGSHSLLQGIFPTLGLNLGLPSYRQIPHHLSHQGSPRVRGIPGWATEENAHVTYCWSTRLWTDAWAAFIFWLLWIMLLWTHACKELFKAHFQLFRYISRSGISGAGGNSSSFLRATFLFLYQFHHLHAHSQDCKEIKSVHLKGNQSWIFIEATDADAEAPVLWPPDVKNWLIREDPDAGKEWRQEEKGMTEDEMVRWHRRLSGHEFEQSLGDGERQGNQACCSPWGCKESDMTVRLNDNNSIYEFQFLHILTNSCYFSIFFPSCHPHGCEVA